MTDTSDHLRDPRAIFLLGMHRSGTSATAGVVALMGAHIGDADKLIPPHASDNPTGYFERNDVKEINDEILKAAGYAWDRVAYFDADRVAARAIEAPVRRIENLVAELNDRSAPWLVKDPRLCLLLRFWQKHAPSATPIVVVRDPREIAASMLSGPRGTFTSLFLIDLWEKYIRTLLAELHGRRALFVSYANLLARPNEECHRILAYLRDAGLANLHAPERDALDNFLRKDLRRSAPHVFISLSPSQTALTDWLKQQCELGGVSVENFPEAAAPDAALAEFEASARYHIEHGRFIAGRETAERLQAIEERLAKRDDERLHWMAEIDTERRHAEAARQESLSIQEKLVAINAEKRALAEVLESTCAENENQALLLSDHAAQIEKVRGELDSFHHHVRNLDAIIQALRDSLSWKITEPLRLMGAMGKHLPRFGAEQRLYKMYYSIPGLSPARKRAMILWMHRHASWLTRNTLSYQLYAQTQRLIRERETNRERRVSMQRMTEERAREKLAAIANRPIISIVMPVYNVDRRWLVAAIESVRRQFYPHWELCIADDASPREETKQALRDITALGDKRIKIRTLEKNRGIAGASNAALEIATGDFVGLLDNDDELTRDALLEVAQRIVADDPDLIYSDEDKIDEDGNNVEPYFKSDYSPDYLLCNNYICHFSVIRRQLFVDVGAFLPGFDGAQDFDLMLRVCERARKVVHIPKILYHWRKIPGSTAATSAGKPYTHEAGRRAVQAAMVRRGVEGESQSGPYPNTYRVRRKIVGQPLVSILVPFRDKAALLNKCIGSIVDKSDYQNFEIVGIDNGSTEPATRKLIETLQRKDSRVRFVPYDKPFNFSAINNFGVTHARGEHLLFLNNDTEVISTDFLGAMLEHSQRPEVGVVGAKLLYSDNTIQHAGVILGLGGVAGHSHLMSPAGHHGYFSRPQLIQNLSAVTFACAMTRRAVFDELQGLNEAELTVAFNDVDYCLRAREAGYLVVYTPYAELYHHESKSRGYEINQQKRDRLARETEYMQTRHREVLQKGDPYYNPNLSLTNNFEPNPRYADELPL